MKKPNKLVQSKAEREEELHQRLISLSAVNARNFFEFGEVLKEIRDDELWKTGGYDSFDAYFSDPELSLSRSSVYHAIALIEHFPEWRELMPIPVSKLIMIVPHLTNENKPKLLEYATGLSKSDLKIQLESLGTQEEHSYRPLPKIYWCNGCKRIKGVYHNELCTCGWTPEQIKKLLELVKGVENYG